MTLFSSFNFTTEEEIVDSFPQTKIVQNQESNKRLQRMRGDGSWREGFKEYSQILFTSPIFHCSFFLGIFLFQNPVIA